MSETRPGASTVERIADARAAVLVVFALSGATFASWAARIADAKVALDLSAGELGTTLVGGSIGAVLGLPLAGRVTQRYGAARTVAAAAALTLGGVLLFGVVVDVGGSRWAAAGALFVVGLGNGVWDVAMNLEGAEVERELARSVMPHFHAAFSGGTVVGALVGAGMSWAELPLVLHFLGVVGLGAVLLWWALHRFLPRAAEPPADRGQAPSADDADAGSASARAGSVSARAGSASPRRGSAVPDARSAAEHAGSASSHAGSASPRRGSAWLEPRTLLIGVVVFAAAFTEGSANDWLAVAFVEGYELPTWAGVLGFATFLTLMTVGRLVGTRLLDTHGRVPVLRVSFALAAAGAALVILGGPIAAFVGAAVWGLGAALGFPVGMSASADDPARAAARMSVVATIGYSAFLAGAPLLGLLGDSVGVLRSLAVVGALALLALAVVPAVRELSPRPATPQGRPRRP
ncbi:MAG: MFS transporter [Dermatophilaceae bacterium]